METPQEALVRLAAAQDVSLAALSRMLGRNVAYLQQYVGRGSPRALPERERERLAGFFGVNERVLGRADRAAADEVGVAYLDVAASAGAGALVAGERVRRHEPLGRALLARAGVRADDASIIDVRGDSMAPTLLDGDRLLADRGATRVGREAGLFVLRIADELSVKRLSLRTGVLRIASDNPAYATRELPVSEMTVNEVTVIGRARLLLRAV